MSHGTLVRRHGFDVLIRSLPKVSGARLEILGDGEARPELERLARELEVDDRVTFAGFVSQERIAERVAAADVGVVANRRDVFMDLVVPTKLMEYVALGLPAVVARTPAIETYFDDQMVRYFEPDDPTDLARALEELSRDEERRRAIASRAAAFQARHGWHVMAARYLAAVEGLSRNGVRASASGAATGADPGRGPDPQ